MTMTIAELVSPISLVSFMRDEEQRVPQIYLVIFDREGAITSAYDRFFFSFRRLAFSLILSCLEEDYLICHRKHSMPSFPPPPPPPPPNLDFATFLQLPPSFLLLFQPPPPTQINSFPHCHPIPIFLPSRSSSRGNDATRVSAKAAAVCRLHLFLFFLFF